MTIELDISPIKMQEQLLIILEKYFYMFADPMPSNDVPSLDGKYIEVTMDFVLDSVGRFSMFIPEDKLEELTANFLGLDPSELETCEVTPLDTANEMMNIAGGGILSALKNDAEKFSMGLPKINVLNRDEGSGVFKRYINTAVLIDERPLYFQMAVDR